MTITLDRNLLTLETAVMLSCVNLFIQVRKYLYFRPFHTRILKKDNFATGIHRLEIRATKI